MQALTMILGLAGGLAADDGPAAGGDFPAPAAPKAKVAWAASYDAALAEAKKSGKLVMVDFYTTWCGPCKMLEQQTYGDAKVAAELAKNFVSVKIDAESAAGEPLAEKHKIEGFPTVLFLDGAGKVVHKHVGFAPAAPFLEKLSGLDDVRNLDKLVAAAKRAPGDGPLAARVVAAHVMQGDAGKAKEFLNAAAEAGLAGVPLAKACNKLGDHHQEAEEYEPAVGYFRRAVKAGDAREKGYALLSIGACLYSEGKLASAKREVTDALEIPGLPADLKKDGERMLEAIAAAADK